MNEIMWPIRKQHNWVKNTGFSPGPVFFLLFHLYKLKFNYIELKKQSRGNRNHIGLRSRTGSRNYMLYGSDGSHPRNSVRASFLNQLPFAFLKGGNR